jgi:hypothetical protein
MVQNGMLTAMPHFAGLNPQAFRFLRKEHLQRNRKHTLLDGQLVGMYERRLFFAVTDWLRR